MRLSLVPTEPHRWISQVRGDRRMSGVNGWADGRGWAAHGCRLLPIGSKLNAAPRPTPALPTMWFNTASVALGHHCILITIGLFVTLQRHESSACSTRLPGDTTLCGR
jgi:hypothetical protein